MPSAVVRATCEERKLFINELVGFQIILLPRNIDLLAGLGLNLPVRRDPELRFHFRSEHAEVITPASAGDDSLSFYFFSGSEDDRFSAHDVDVFPDDLKVSTLQSCPKIVQSDKPKTGITPKTADVDSVIILYYFHFRVALTFGQEFRA